MRGRRYSRVSRRLLYYAKPERKADLAALRARVGKIFKGKHELELACGTGYWTDVIAERAQHVTALDVNDEVLEIARSKKNAGKVTFLRGSAYEIPLQDRVHDALFAGFWWSHVPLEKLDGFLKDISSRIKPGALIAFLDNRYVEGSSTPVSRRDTQGNSYQARKLDDGSTHEVLKNFPDESELIRRVSRHGWGAHVDLLPHYWMLTWWAPK